MWRRERECDSSFLLKPVVTPALFRSVAGPIPCSLPVVGFQDFRGVYRLTGAPAPVRLRMRNDLSKLVDREAARFLASAGLLANAQPHPGPPVAPASAPKAAE